MKRKIFAALAISAIAFVSCKKDEPVAPADPGSATVKGTLWANTDTNNDTDGGGFYMETFEEAPSGIVITAVINSMDLDQTPDPLFDYQDMSWTATTDADGNFTFTGLPCYNTSIDCELRFNDFTADQKQGTNDVETDYFGGTATVSIWNGAVVINDFTY
jgi:hypothetical protein